jgi:hypothetical protein
MADLNSLIAQGVQFKAPPDPFAQYAQMQQLQQGEQANQLNQMKMQEYQRGVQEQNQLRQLYATPGMKQDSPEFAQRMAAISPAAYQEHVKAVQSQRQSEANIGLAGARTLEAAGKTATSNFDLGVAKANKAIVDIAALDSPEAAIASLDKHVKDGALDPVKADALKAELAGAVDFHAWQDKLLQGALSAKDKILMTESKPVEKTDGQQTWMVEGNPRLPTFGKQIGAAPIQMRAKPGEVLTAETTRRGQNLLDTREKENIAIRQEEQRRTGDPVFVQKMAQANAMGQAIAKDSALAQQLLPKVIDTANETLSEIDSLIGKRDNKGKLLKGEAPHPGFQDVVGATWRPGLRFVPGTDAASFQTRFDQIKGGAFMQAYETLKGGGQITNVEGDKGTSAINRMNTAQSEQEFITAARDFQGVIRRAVERAKTRVGGGTTSPTNSIHDQADAILRGQ